jgi:hypothetical protein
MRVVGLFSARSMSKTGTSSAFPKVWQCISLPDGAARRGSNNKLTAGHIVIERSTVAVVATHEASQTWAWAMTAAPERSHAHCHRNGSGRVILDRIARNDRQLRGDLLRTVGVGPLDRRARSSRSICAFFFAFACHGSRVRFSFKSSQKT